MTDRKNDRKSLSPQGAIALGFALLIALTALLLMFPVSSRTRTWTDPLTALFTAASAACVTGLVLVDTAQHWSFFGQLVILLAIQAGGLGVITVTAWAAALLGRRIGLRQRTVLAESISSMDLGSVVRLTRFAVALSLLLEGAGAALLALRFVPLLGLFDGVWYSVFHAVSAFCNAGFDLMGALSGPFSSLEAFSGDPFVLLTICALILSGALGFFVWQDLFVSRFRFRRLRLHSRAVLAMAPFWLFIPAALFLLFERASSMSGMPPEQRLLASLFSAVTPRTAGFSLFPADALSPASTLLTLMLMLVGGNPGSTAGGVKTTTLLVLLLCARSLVLRSEDVVFAGRRLAQGLVRRACAIVLIYLLLMLAAALTICALEPELALSGVVYEVFSAANTVGMSAGITQTLKPASLCILILLMYAGRLGSLTLAVLTVRRTQPCPLRFPEDTLMTG